MQGRAADARTLLQHHSAFRAGSRHGPALLCDVLHAMPSLASADLSLPEFPAQWTLWQQQCQAARDALHGGDPQLVLLARILCGEPAVFVELRFLFPLY